MTRCLSKFSRPSLTACALVCAAGLLSLGLFVASASATVMKYVGIAQLVDMSDMIVYGQVTGQKTYFDATQKRVVTDTTMTVKRSFYGDAHDSVTIQQWGGTYDGKTSVIAGDAHFSPGEQAVVFLHRGRRGLVALTAMAQAKYTVIDTDSGMLVTRDLSDIGFLKPGKHNAKSITHLPAESRSFDSFVAELTSLVAGIKGGNHE